MKKMSELSNLIEACRQAQLKHERRIPVQLELPLERRDDDEKPDSEEHASLVQ